MKGKKRKGLLALALAALMICQPVGAYAEEFTSEAVSAQTETDVNTVQEESADATQEESVDAAAMEVAEEDVNLLSSAASYTKEDGANWVSDGTLG